MGKAQDILDRHKILAKPRDQWKTLWQDLADILYPNRGGFTSPLIPGQETLPLYDTTPMQARRGLATAIDSLMKPNTSKWFWMKAKQEALNDDDDAKRWFEHVQARMWSAIYDPLARFIQHSGAVDNDLSAFGLGYLWIGERKNRDGLNFRSIHIGDCAIDENSDGQVDTIYRAIVYTARQAQQRFGDQVGAKVKEALKDDKKKDQTFEFVQAIYPNSDRDPTKKDNTNMPFVNCVVGVLDQNIVEESGFEEFPIAVPRWEVSAGEIYPRSPGMVALPDARTLQSMGRTLLIGGERAVDPPFWIADDAAMSAVRTHPGGMTVVDAEVLRSSGGKPIGHFDVAANIPIGREMQDDYRKMVGSAFFSDLFKMPEQDRMTATEVMARKEEFLRKIGPTLGQLENDYIGVIVRRVFGLMFRAGAFDPPPDVLAGRDVQFEFMSPVQQAKRQIETASFGQAFQFLTPIFQMKPDAADNINSDEIVRDAPEMFGVPTAWINTKDQVAAARQQRAQQMQVQAGLAAAQQGTEALSNAADAEHSAAKARSVSQETQGV